MHFDLKIFEDFLKSVPLEEYRKKYANIKIVEMDLPKNIQILDLMYAVYWNDNRQYGDKPYSFDQFYEIYYKSKEEEIRKFWHKSGFGLDCECFPKGLKARIYRTWASLITQIQAGYMAESVFGKGNIEQSSELDHRGVDILIHYKGSNIAIQIKKESKRPEVGRMYAHRIRKEPNKSIKDFDIVDIWYVVPQEKDYFSPLYKVGKRKGELKDSIKSFVKYNSKDGTLNRLDNGFVIFTSKEFEIIKALFDGLSN